MTAWRHRGHSHVFILLTDPVAETEDVCISALFAGLALLSSLFVSGRSYGHSYNSKNGVLTISQYERSIRILALYAVRLLTNATTKLTTTALVYARCWLSNWSSWSSQRSDLFASLFVFHTDTALILSPPARSLPSSLPGCVVSGKPGSRGYAIALSVRSLDSWNLN